MYIDSCCTRADVLKDQATGHNGGLSVAPTAFFVAGYGAGCERTGGDRVGISDHHVIEGSVVNAGV